jgi:hypothetical protein
MEIKIETIHTVTGNTSVSDDQLGQIILRSINAKTPIEHLSSVVLKEWMNTSKDYQKPILPLIFHAAKGVNVKTTVVNQMLLQVYPTGSYDYSFTYEARSFWYECINTFPNREFLLLDKETNRLINYVAPEGVDVLMMT